MMENQLEREEVLAFLKGLAGPEHGIAVHRASLDWARAALAGLSGAGPGSPG